MALLLYYQINYYNFLLLNVIFKGFWDDKKDAFDGWLSLVLYLFVSRFLEISILSLGDDDDKK